MFDDEKEKLMKTVEEYKETMTSFSKEIINLKVQVSRLTKEREAHLKNADKLGKLYDERIIDEYEEKTK